MKHIYLHSSDLLISSNRRNITHLYIVCNLSLKLNSHISNCVSLRLISQQTEFFKDSRAMK